jgi:hypothetical protein
MTDRDGEAQLCLEVLEGGRDSLEREIATALFTPAGVPRARALLARLKHRARLTAVPATDWPVPPAPPR